MIHLSLSTFKYYSFIVLILFIYCGKSDTYTPEFKLEGKWKEIKGDTIFEKDRKEIIFDIQRVGEDFSGQIISLDNALDANGNIRKCLKCTASEEGRMILGIPFLRNLHRSKGSNDYKGEIYDVQQRKWFDVRIRPLAKDSINIRTYAGLQFFGKNLTWERGDDFYKEILSKSPQKYSPGKRGIYAVNPGYVDYVTEKEVIVKCSVRTGFGINDPFYFYSLEGKKIGEGLVSVYENDEIRIKLVENEFRIDPNLTVPVVLYHK